MSEQQARELFEEVGDLLQGKPPDQVVYVLVNHLLILCHQAPDPLDSAERLAAFITGKYQKN